MSYINDIAVKGAWSKQRVYIASVCIYEYLFSNRTRGAYSFNNYEKLNKNNFFQ